MLPFMPLKGVCTCSLCTGSYISIELGTTGLGKVNNLRFPVPETATFKSSDSPLLSWVLVGFTTKLNRPTAPEKSSGFPASGNGFTLMVLLPAETRRLSLTTCTWPKMFRRLVGTCKSMSSESGSISNLPDFCGYKTVFRSTT